MPWTCARCNQLNADWYEDCGRCSLARGAPIEPDEKLIDFVFKEMTKKPREKSCTADPKLYIRDAVRLYLQAATSSKPRP